MSEKFDFVAEARKAVAMIEEKCHLKNGLQISCVVNGKMNIPGIADGSSRVVIFVGGVRLFIDLGLQKCNDCLRFRFGSVYAGRVSYNLSYVIAKIKKELGFKLFFNGDKNGK